MPLLLIYCLKLSVSLTLVSLFYQLVLRKLTFYNWNRYYLLGYSLLSFFVAFIDISPVLKQKEWGSAEFVLCVPILNSIEIVTSSSDTPGFFTTWNIVSLLLIMGMGIMFFRLLFQLFSFGRLVKKAEHISAEGMKFYQVNDSIIPFSFGNSIFINRHLHSEADLKEIILHEFVHVKQKHSIDIILAEILCLLNWYNPFAWFLKAAIRQNLEFIADNKVLEHGINRKEYQYLLLKVVGNNQFSIAPKFNFSSLKKRIAMMNKLKTARLNLVRFLFVLPLVVVLLLAFRNKGLPHRMMQKNNQNTVSISSTISPIHILTDTVPKSSKSQKQPVANETPLSTVSDDYEISDERAVIHLKNGTTEEYDFNNKEQRKKFEEKYGRVINTSVHVSPTVAVSAINVEGVATTIEPSIVIGNGIGTGNGNGIGSGNGISSPTVITTTSSVSTSAKIATKPTINSVSTSVVAPVAIAGGPVTTISDYGSTISGDEEILLTITKNTTRQQLEEFKKQMKEKGIDLNFNEIEYDGNGVLIRLRGTVKAKDNNSSFSASGFNKLILSMITEGDHFLFRVRTTSNKEVI
jgi:hypothetical protein